MTIKNMKTITMPLDEYQEIKKINDEIINWWIILYHNILWEVKIFWLNKIIKISKEVLKKYWYNDKEWEYKKAYDDLLKRYNEVYEENLKIKKGYKYTKECELYKEKIYLLEDEISILKEKIKKKKFIFF